MKQNLQQHKKRFIISGGGTGGHIFPAIAIADALSSKLGECEILFVGATGRMEMDKVPQAGYNITGLWISGLQRKLSFRNLLFPVKVASSLLKARRIIRTFKPDIAIGTGGYASGPTLQMASSLGIPTIIQEQNSFPGITNKFLGKKAKKICVAYEGMEKYFSSDKIVFTGNPVRKTILDAANRKEEGLRHFMLKKELPVVLIVGGSQGARSVNHAISRMLEFFLKQNIQLIWQTGQAYEATAVSNLEHLTKERGTAEASVRIMPFIKEMELAYGAADIVISRAGAIAISELCIASRPAILVPLPSAAEDHQTRNARFLAERNAGILIPDKSLEEQLEPVLAELISDKERQKKMADSIKKLAVFDSADRIAEVIINITGT